MIWFLDKHYSADVKEKFLNLTKVFALNEGSIVSKDSICTVIKVKVEEKFFYVKLYTGSGKGLRKYFGKSRCRAEWENLKFCQKLKINTPKIVAYGERAWPFRIRPYKGVLITEEVVKTRNLAEIAQQHPKLFKQQEWRAKVLGIVADYVGRLHRNHFIHTDLKLRNILVSGNVQKPAVYFFDMPAGKKLQGWAYRRGVKKDLAILNKSAAPYFSQTERLRFYLMYAIKPMLNKSTKNFVISVLNMCRKRYERARNK